MIVKIIGTIEGENDIKNKFSGVVNVVGTFINEMAVQDTVLHIIFNPGPTIELSAKKIALIPKGKEHRKLSGTIDKCGKQNRIEGVIAENGIFITVFGDGGKPEYGLWNPGDTEEIDPQWSCIGKK